jgi:hypothetical protein
MIFWSFGTKRSDASQNTAFSKLEALDQELVLGTRLAAAVPGATELH